MHDKLRLDAELDGAFEYELLLRLLAHILAKLGNKQEKGRDQVLVDFHDGV